MSLQPGQRLASYELLEQIGSGGMGEVFRAFDTKLNRQVAIKVLLPDLMANSEKRQRFLREAHTSAAVSHPYVASIYEVGEIDGAIFIVMEFVEGRTLRAQLRKQAMEIPDALNLATEIVEGLAHAHEARVIHRDLKPENIMVRPDGHPKILDFGVAKLLEGGGVLLSAGTSGESLHTGEGRIVGTVAYMSPEQARAKDVDERSDIFSFGILLYEMITGRAPFGGSEAIDTLSAILMKDPAPAVEINPDVPDELQQILIRCLKKKPEDRYQRMADLLADLKVARLALQEQALKEKTTADALSAPAAAKGADRKPARLLGWAALAAVVVAGAAVGYVKLRPAPAAGANGASSATESEGPAAARTRKMIVVLPFENLGSDEDEYFAAGMTDEITSRLAASSGLGVISRTSAVQYAGTKKTVKQIGQELGVDFVLEGTIRWARQPGGSSRVRITPQLIRVADDTHLWADSYDEVIDDVFRVQSEIAVKVIDQLGVTLLDGERAAMGSKPTNSPEAYQAYLAGRHAFRQPEYTEEGFERQASMFEHAIELDPSFAQAYAALSTAHSALYHFGHDRTAERQEKARSAIEKAVELAPDAPETQLALGWYYYWAHKDYDKALEAFALAKKKMPNNAELLAAEAFIHRRQGRWEAAAEELEQAFPLNPLDARLITELGDTYVSLRKYPQAEGWLNKAVALVPDQSLAYGYLAHMYWLWEGSTEKARGALEAMPKTDDPASLWYWFWTDIYSGRYDEALSRLEASPVDVIREQFFFAPKELLAAQAYTLMNEPGRARRSFEAAREVLKKELMDRPDDHRAHSAMGVTLAGLGLGDEAILEGNKAVAGYPISYDANAGLPWVQNLALIYTMLGDQDAALDQVEKLLSIPSKVSIHLLELDPRWKVLRDTPRFREMTERYGGGSK